MKARREPLRVVHPDPAGWGKKPARHADPWHRPSAFGAFALGISIAALISAVVVFCMALWRWAFA